MLLKVKLPNERGWKYFSEITEVEVSEKLRTYKWIKGQEECGAHYSYKILRYGMEMDDTKYSEDSPVMTIRFEHAGSSKMLVFDTIAYLCSNEGKTVERICN